MSDTPARVFISYSRKDGAAFAAELRETLRKQDLSVWQDIVALEGGRDWWSQIEDVLRHKALQHFVLVVTPAALASPVVRQEIRLARQEGKTVSPVKGPGLVELEKVPRWFGNVYELDRPESLAAFIGRLRRDSEQKRAPMMAPEPPADFVRRPAEFEALKSKLLDAKGDAVAISAALRGAGGYGKTTLAKALAHDPDIQDAYFDGVLWVELGEQPDNLLGGISDLIAILTGEPPGLATLNAAAAALGEAMSDRRILLIVDDVWREQDLRPFLQGGRNATRLITTRLSRVLPADAFRRTVDAMTGEEALALLASGLPRDQVHAESGPLSQLAGRLGEWAQLLKLVNGFLRERVIEGGEPLKDALADANARLTDEGLVSFDADDEDDRTKAVAQTINLSLGLLDDKQRARFAELAVFPEDADIPIGIVSRLWRLSSGLGEGQTKDLLSKFYGLSLLLGFDLNLRTIRFHDTIRRFLQDQAGKPGMVELHKRLVQAIEGIGGSPDADPHSRRYYYFHLPHHLAEAGERETLDKLLIDPGWLKAKLAATSSPQSLVTDYEMHGAGELQDFIGRTLRLTTGILARDARQLMPQLLGRITSCGLVGASDFLEATRGQVSRPAILERRLSLTPPGAETVRMEGHWNSVHTLCMLPDGRIASGAADNTIRLWDLKSGIETAQIAGHTGWVNSLCLLPDGRLASGASDNTIRLWDLSARTESRRLEGHTGNVTAVCALPDKRLASCAEDNTIRVWSIETGAEVLRLDARFVRGTSGLCALPDGRLASASEDGVKVWDIGTGAEAARLGKGFGGVTALCALQDGGLASGHGDSSIRLWDLTAGVQTARLSGHESAVTALCALADGRIASGSYDNTIRVWDAAGGAETRRLEGHAATINALCALPDGRFASGSADHTVRLWDVAAGRGTAIREGHTQRAVALCKLSNGRVASGSWDQTIRVWDERTGLETARLEGHTHWVVALCALPDETLASGSADATIRLWDLTRGAETARLEGHKETVSALCAMTDGRLASGSWDKTIRLWDVTSGIEVALLDPHTNWVTGLILMPDGRLVSGSSDGTIRLWDAKNGAAEIRRMEENAGATQGLCMLPDGRLASRSWDHEIRLWDIDGGSKSARLEGHRGSVSALCALGEGRLASGSQDRTIRLWDLKTGKETARLETDAPILCLVDLPSGGLVAGDAIGRLHWLEIVE